MKKATRPWVRKAEDDYQTARRLLGGKTRLHDQICFHCQQAAEKYLKALLQEQGAAVPRTHDLPEGSDVLLIAHRYQKDARFPVNAQAIQQVQHAAIPVCGRCTPEQGSASSTLQSASQRRQ